MPAYRFYNLPRTHRGEPVEAIFFDDTAAMVWGLRSTEALGVEIWQGARFVARLHGSKILTPAPAE